LRPARIAAQVEPLRKLLETRDRLRDLMSKVDRSEDLESLLAPALAATSPSATNGEAKP
jgi:type VI secretion system protein ImpB